MVTFERQGLVKEFTSEKKLNNFLEELAMEINLGKSQALIDCKINGKPVILICTSEADDIPFESPAHGWVKEFFEYFNLMSISEIKNQVGDDIDDWGYGTGTYPEIRDFFIKFMEKKLGIKIRYIFHEW